MRFLGRLFRADPQPPLPDRDLAVIGDLHGRADLLEAMVEQLANAGGTERTLVFVGDYIDRGEASASVLGLLQALQKDLWPGDVICLKGNHEAMLLDFLDAPEEAGPFWIHNGGAHTLASFGIRPAALAPDTLGAARDALRDAMGPQTEAWLRALPLSFRSGNVLVTHAGADPHAPVAQQQETHLLWGHPDFLTTPRRDGIWIAHGHTILEAPSAQAGRISVDTGAYATHRLSAALITQGECRFLTT